MTDLAKRLGVALPIVQAPMAGGPDSPALAAAVSDAGALGSLGCAYLTPARIEAVAAEVRRLTARPFALNLFARVDEPDDTDADAEARVLPIVRAFRHELGLGDEITLGAVPPPFDVQLEAVLRVAPAVFSFTFGVPTREQVAELRGRDIVVVGTATCVDEADALVALGVDAICAQGAEAGGHRGTFLGRFEDALVGTMTLVPQIAQRVPTTIAVIAAGGIMDGAGIRAALALGASAAQLGTAFMTSRRPARRRRIARRSRRRARARPWSRARSAAARRAAFATA